MVSWLWWPPCLFVGHAKWTSIVCLSVCLFRSTLAGPTQDRNSHPRGKTSSMFTICIQTVVCLKDPYLVPYFFLYMLMTLVLTLNLLFLYLLMTPYFYVPLKIPALYILCYLMTYVSWRGGLICGVLLTFNAAKTEVLTITNNPSLHPPLRFCNQALNEATSHKHLGLIFHRSLTWHLHISTLHNRAMSLLNTFKKIKNFLPRYALLVLYRAYVSPIVDYW